MAGVFRESMTLLYRMLLGFLGEARQAATERQPATRRGQSRFHRMKTGTVPSPRPKIGTVPGLRELADEIAGVAGSDPRRTADRIAAAYSATETRLHRRLDRLLAKMGTFAFPGRSAAISPPLAVPDRFLAAAIDGLARCIGPAGRLVAVDFCAMDVRQLGVVHECLSHCKLVISPQGRPILAGDRAGRKRAGSYYTPEPIVRRIVAGAVGPAIERKLQAVRRRWEGGGLPADAEMLAELLDFRVLDPAVGSGYFLLAAADFLANRLDDFLRSLPRGKRTRVALASRRRVALASRQCSAQALARRQCHPEEAGRLSLPLLKREVVRRCVYGVDLDPVAVELAKASLLLDAGMSPAARRHCFCEAVAHGGLSASLDAHFRCGNSLVGDTLAELGGGAGFDVVVGNPPYRGVRTGTFDRAFAKYVASHYAAARGNWDLAALFLEKSLAVGKPESACGFIVPSRIAANRDFAALRQRIFAVGGPAEVIECGPVFDDPAVLASIVTIVRPPESGSVRLGRWKDGKEKSWTITRSMLQSLPDRPLFSDLRPGRAALFRRIDRAPCRLGELAAITRGMECGKNDPHITRRPRAGFLPVITGQAVREFHVEPQGLFIPPGLKPVAKYKRRELFATVPKLLVRFVAPHPIAAVDLQGYVHCNTVYAVVLARPSPDAYAALACLLNSRPLRWWFARAFNSAEGIFPHIQKYQIARIPLPRLDDGSAAMARLARLGRAAAVGGKFDREAIEAACLAAFGLEQWE